ncbi:MAG: MFS transporter [Betaproteobacteria bacterium]|nr:MFS transporter [Betaproteobacteria bacterium]
MPQVARTDWRGVWAIFAIGVMSAAYIGKAPPALPMLRGELDLTLVESGLIATMFNVLGGLVGIFAGMLADRFGHKRAALTGLAALVGGSLLGVFAGDYAAVLLGRFFEGAGFILASVSGVALMTHVTQLADRPRAMALWSAYMPTGGTAALVAAPWLLAAVGWRGLWLVIAVLTAGCFFLVLRAVPAVAPHARVGFARLARESLSQPGSLLLCVAFIGYAAQWASVLVWLPTFAIDERGASTELAALLTAGMVAANVPGNLLGGPLMARGVSRARLIAFGACVQALSSAGIFLDLLPDVGRYLSCLSFSFFGGLIPMAVMSGIAVHARTPAHIGTTNGMVMQVSQIGQFFGPMLVAWLATRFAWSASLGAMLAYAALTLAAGIAIARVEARRAGQAAR